MATYTYEDVTPTLIENTTMKKMLIDGVYKTYWITSKEGYVLHDKEGNWQAQDEITGEWHEVDAYYRGTCTCAANYDFTANPREFYTIPENEAPADQIFGGGGNTIELGCNDKAENWRLITEEEYEKIMQAEELESEHI